MRIRKLIAPTAMLLVLYVGAFFSSFGAEGEASEEARAVTTGDHQVPHDELVLMLKPLTKGDLLVEAQAWQELLKQKAEEISQAEIAVKRQNNDTENAGETQGEAAEATAQTGQVEQDTEEPPLQESSRSDPQPAAESGPGAPEQIEATHKDGKAELLESVNDLREERTVLIDRLNAVLDDLKGKTDEEDAETLATIKDYRRYITAVSGIEIDVKDTTSAWAAIEGWLTSEEGGLRWAKNIALFLGILAAAWFVSKLLSRAVHRALGMVESVSQLLENFLVGAVRWIVMSIGIIMALAALEVSIGPLLAIVGAAGFVIAFALQDSLSNFASGIMILFFRPFDVGDAVDAGGVSGSVTSMNLVSTTIKTFDNKQMVVPNNKIWSDVITNATGVDTRRVDMEFGIGYDDDIDRAQAILEELVTGHPKVLADPAPKVRMHTLADSSVNFICRPWAKTEDYWDVYWDITKAVKLRFDAEGIGIPFPQRDIHLYLRDSASGAALASLGQGAAQSGGANPQPYELEEDEESSSDA